MSLIFFVFLGCALLSGIGIFYKKEILMPVASALILFFCTVATIGNFVWIWDKKTVFEVVFLPFFDRYGQTYFWELYLDFPVSLALLCLVTGVFLFYVFALYRRFLIQSNILEATLFAVCFGALMCFGAKNVFQFLIGWEICFVFAGLFGTLFSLMPDKALTFKRFWIYHKISDMPLYIVLCALCLRPDNGLITPFQSPATAFLLFSLCGAIIFKAACLEVLSDAKVPAFVVLFIALFVFGVCFSYVLCRFSPIGTFFAFPLHAFVVPILFFLGAGTFLSFRRENASFGFVRSLKRRLRLVFIRRIRPIFMLSGMKKIWKRTNAYFIAKTKRLNEAFNQNALVFIIGMVCLFVLSISFFFLKG